MSAAAVRRSRRGLPERLELLVQEGGPAAVRHETGVAPPEPEATGHQNVLLGHASLDRLCEHAEPVGVQHPRAAVIEATPEVGHPYATSGTLPEERIDVPFVATGRLEVGEAGGIEDRLARPGDFAQQAESLHLPGRGSSEGLRVAAPGNSPSPVAHAATRPNAAAPPPPRTDPAQARGLPHDQQRDEGGGDSQHVGPRMRVDEQERHRPEREEQRGGVRVSQLRSRVRRAICDARLSELIAHRSLISGTDPRILKAARGLSPSS